MISSFPLQLLLECKPYIITVETKNGNIYRGKLKHIENNMNFYLENVVLLNNQKKIKRINYLFLRGSSISIVLLPDILKEIPLFN